MQIKTHTRQNQKETQTREQTTKQQDAAWPASQQIVSIKWRHWYVTHAHDCHASRQRRDVKLKWRRRRICHWFLSHSRDLHRGSFDTSTKNNNHKTGFQEQQKCHKNCASIDSVLQCCQEKEGRGRVERRPHILLPRVLIAQNNFQSKFAGIGLSSRARNWAVPATARTW